MENTRIHPSVAAARRVDVPVDVVARIRAAYRQPAGDARVAELTAIRDEVGHTTFQLAKFRAIAANA